MPTNAAQSRIAPASQPGGLEFVVRKFELKMLGDEAPGSAPRFSGHGAVFHNVDSVGDIIAPGAFADGLADFLQDGFIGGLNHNWDDPIGNPVAAYEDAKGLYLETGDIVDTAHGSDVAKLLRKKIIKKLSIGFTVPPGGAQRLASMDAVRAYWKGHQYNPSAQDMARAAIAVKASGLEFDEDGDIREVKGLRMLRKINLYEVSPVTRPANMLADVTVVKSAKAEKESRTGGLVTGRTLFDHSRDVVTALREFTKRVEDRAAFRAVVPRHADEEKAGRMFSRVNTDALTAVSAAMRECSTSLEDVLSRAQPVPADEPAIDDAKAETPPGEAPPADMHRHPAVEPATPAVTLPAPVESAPAVPPSVPDAPPAFDDADILAQYAHTQYALTMAAVGSPSPHA